MTELETGMALLLKTFDSYASVEGDKRTLSKGELKTMLNKELPGLQAAKNQGEVDKLMKDLDINNDSQVDFTEFVVMVTALSVAVHSLGGKK